jgi:hypothetical protein
MSAGRKLKLSPAEQRRFRRLYPDPRLSKMDLMLSFDLSDNAVRAYAIRLGLPLRPPAFVGQSDMSKIQAGYRAWRKTSQVRGEKAQLARLEQAEKRQHGPTPQFYRCQECGGVSEGRERHPRCEEAA